LFPNESEASTEHRVKVERSLYEFGCPLKN